MATTGSEFSLSNPEELEMDYYDYNVINSAAAPGSYLGEGQYFFSFFKQLLIFFLFKYFSMNFLIFLKIFYEFFFPV